MSEIGKKEVKFIAYILSATSWRNGTTLCYVAIVNKNNYNIIPSTKAATQVTVCTSKQQLPTGCYLFIYSGILHDNGEIEVLEYTTVYPEPESSPLALDAIVMNPQYWPHNIMESI